VGDNCEQDESPYKALGDVRPPYIHTEAEAPSEAVLGGHLLARLHLLSGFMSKASALSDFPGVREAKYFEFRSRSGSLQLCEVFFQPAS